MLENVSVELVHNLAWQIDKQRIYTFRLSFRAGHLGQTVKFAPFSPNHTYETNHVSVDEPKRKETNCARRYEQYFSKLVGSESCVRCVKDKKYVILTNPKLKLKLSFGAFIFNSSNHPPATHTDK